MEQLICRYKKGGSLSVGKVLYAAKGFKAKDVKQGVLFVKSAFGAGKKKTAEAFKGIRKGISEYGENLLGTKAARAEGSVNRSREAAKDAISKRKEASAITKERKKFYEDRKAGANDKYANDMAKILQNKERVVTKKSIKHATNQGRLKDARKIHTSRMNGIEAVEGRKYRLAQANERAAVENFNEALGKLMRDQELLNAALKSRRKTRMITGAVAGTGLAGLGLYGLLRNENDSKSLYGGGDSAGGGAGGRWDDDEIPVPVEKEKPGIIVLPLPINKPTIEDIEDPEIEEPEVVIKPKKEKKSRVIVPEKVVSEPKKSPYEDIMYVGPGGDAAVIGRPDGSPDHIKVDPEVIAAREPYELLPGLPVEPSEEEKLIIQQKLKEKLAEKVARMSRIAQEALDNYGKLFLIGQEELNY